MKKGRIEAFSDGVFAIIITIMVLEIKVPQSTGSGTLVPLIPKFISYALSFVFVGIYWNNHHHLFHAIKRVTGRIMWANLNLLFWLSLFPVATGWMGEHQFALWPVVAYGAVLCLAAMAYLLLVIMIKKTEGSSSLIVDAIGNDIKGKVSVAGYVLGIALSFVIPWLGAVLYCAVAAFWFIPDKRIERVIAAVEAEHEG